MAKRARAQRRALRLPVTFWRLGEEGNGVAGYSLNISRGGMFVATRRPLPPNAIVELEIEQPKKTTRTTGRVMHSARFPADYQQVFKSGMGIRFHQPDDPEVGSLAQMGQPLPDRGGRRLFSR